jgi:hypothetical protein
MSDPWVGTAVAGGLVVVVAGPVGVVSGVPAQMREA